jgi:hypothetical protein
MEDKTQQDISNIPNEVAQVAAAWRANAAKAGMPEDACCVEYERLESRDHYGPYYRDSWGDPDRDILDQGEEQPAWTVCCNYESAVLSLTYFPSDGRWLSYSRGRDSSSLIKGGTTEAIANAEIVYTG